MAATSDGSIRVLRLVNAYRLRIWSITALALTIASITKITLAVANNLTAKSTTKEFGKIWVVTQHARAKIFSIFYLSSVGSIAYI